MSSYYALPELSSRCFSHNRVNTKANITNTSTTVTTLLSFTWKSGHQFSFNCTTVEGDWTTTNQPHLHKNITTTIPLYTRLPQPTFSEYYWIKEFRQTQLVSISDNRNITSEKYLIHRSIEQIVLLLLKKISFYLMCHSIVWTSEIMNEKNGLGLLKVSSCNPMSSERSNKNSKENMNGSPGSKKRGEIPKVFFKLENGVLSFLEILCIFRKYKGFPKNLKCHFRFLDPPKYTPHVGGS